MDSTFFRLLGLQFMCLDSWQCDAARECMFETAALSTYTWQPDTVTEATSLS